MAPTASYSFDRGLRQTIDWWLIACYVALVIIGWVSIYASIYSSEPNSIFDLSSRSGKQFIWMIVVFIVDLVLLFVINPKLWEVITPWIYLFVLAQLVLVIFLSNDVKGSHSWFELGPIRFQPAEVSKITTSLMLALVLGRSGFNLKSFKGVVLVFAILGLPMLAIMGENETGSALVYGGYAFVLYSEGLSGWWLFAIAVSILILILTITISWWVAILALLVICILCCSLLMNLNPRVSYRKKIIKCAIAGAIAGSLLIFASEHIFYNILQDHQRSRIEVLFGMKEDPSGVGYNVRQSMIAIGSGGFTGKGFLNGTQTTFGFVPEQSTDFIFCTIGEEHGFIGAFVVILLYAFMIFRIMSNADKCRDPFTKIYGNCLAACLFMHLFINIGMTIGLMPVIGIPLPFLSYGGSSLLTFSSMLFIFLALYRQENKYF